MCLRDAAAGCQLAGKPLYLQQRTLRTVCDKEEQRFTSRIMSPPVLFAFAMRHVLCDAPGLAVMLNAQ